MFVDPFLPFLVPSTEHPTSMARNPPRQNTGILSNVFSFVSRELESFVVNATGGEFSDPGPSQPRKRLPVKPGKSCEGSRRRQRREDKLSEDEDLVRVLKTRGPTRQQELDHKGAHRKANISEEKARSKARTHTKQSPFGRTTSKPAPYAEDADEELSASDASSRAPSPVPLPRALRRRPSITMPGSLFPRSSSLEPELDERGTPVRFSTSFDEGEDLQPGPSKKHPDTSGKQVPDSTTQSARDDTTSTSGAPSPWRLNAVSSVRDAVERFHAGDAQEADFSLLLASPDSSPVKGNSKGASAQGTHEASYKGKQKERVPDEDDFSFGLGADTSGVIRVLNKELELDAVRRDKDTRESGDEREKDKERIRMLEDEIRRLKEELSKRSRHSSPPDHANMPPPAPPPPPPIPVRIPLATSLSSGDPNMFLSARAALRHTAPPVEAPINGVARLNSTGLARTKRQGQPTVNVPSDKMAAFLNEMKTVRLRKVSGSAIPGPSLLGRSTSAGGTAAGNAVAGPSSLSRSVGSSSGTGPPVLDRPRRNSTSIPLGTQKEAGVRAGAKRKIDAIGGDEFQDALRAVVKRRSAGASDTSTSSSASGTSSSRPSNIPSALSSLNRTWPSIPAPANETDITTPSLCSDNEDREGNGSVEDRLPSTPPGPRTSASDSRQKASGYRDREFIDVDMDGDEDAPTRPTRTPGSPHIRRPSNDLFTKRPPMSPIAVPTPRKAKPPARTRRGATPKPKIVFQSDDEDEDSDDEDPLSLTFSLSKGKTPPRPSKQRASLDQPSRKSRRRWTLDEELRDAHARSSDNDLDSGVLVGVGSRSKRKGFLAHGGAGGAPVFMGVGYVEGAEEEDEEYQPRRTSKSKMKVR
ncbi:hypothetical protein BV22DRAFT_243402 [Leucogyrophana mollusca]|uniref:Uncharacterized protein n=1 Tax=Leucogyrophana mollusca TaxID=85980 RepID=A0ACB8BPY0_9AGAM|nr:hypothetical protein BV22DRAFT_243402 [Leucogyrophana mollusca]